MTDTPPSSPGRPYPYVAPSPAEPARMPSPPSIPTVFERAPVDPLQSLADRRLIMVTGRLDERGAGEVIAQLLAFDDRQDEPVTLLVNSGGGPLEAVLPVLDIVSGANAPVHAVALGQAIGTAALLVTLTTGDRLISPNATMSLRLEAEASFAGPSDEVLARAEQRQRHEQRLAVAVAGRTALTADAVEEAFARGTAHDADGAVAAGLVDRRR